MSRPRVSALRPLHLRVRRKGCTPAGWITECRRTTGSRKGRPTLRIGERHTSGARKGTAEIAKAILPIDFCSHRRFNHGRMRKRAYARHGSGWGKNPFGHLNRRTSEDCRIIGRMEIEADEGLHSPILSVPANAVSAFFRSEASAKLENARAQVRMSGCLA